MSHCISHKTNAGLAGDEENGLPYQRTALSHWCDRCFLWKG